MCQLFFLDHCFFQFFWNRDIDLEMGHQYRICNRVEKKKEKRLEWRGRTLLLQYHSVNLFFEDISRFPHKPWDKRNSLEETQLPKFTIVGTRTSMVHVHIEVWKAKVWWDVLNLIACYSGRKTHSRAPPCIYLAETPSFPRCSYSLFQERICARVSWRKTFENVEFSRPKDPFGCFKGVTPWLWIWAPGVGKNVKRSSCEGFSNRPYSFWDGIFQISESSGPRRREKSNLWGVQQ